MRCDLHSKPHCCQCLCIASEFQFFSIKIYLTWCILTLQIDGPMHGILIHSAVRIIVKYRNSILILSGRSVKMFQISGRKRFQRFWVATEYQITGLVKWSTLICRYHQNGIALTDRSCHWSDIRRMHSCKRKPGISSAGRSCQE